MASPAQTKAMYEALVAAFRAQPANARHAAKVAGCDRATARRAWERGWDEPWAPAISAKLEAERKRGRRLAAVAAGALLLVGAVALAVTAREPAPQTEAETAPAPLVRTFDVSLPEHFPTDVDPSASVGATVCAECHAEAYAAWRQSPHGKAMAEPSEVSILGRFDGTRLDVTDGSVTVGASGGRWWMDLRGPAGIERHDVHSVLASGRQHQSYFTKTKDGTLKTLPVFWTTIEDKWVPTDVVRQSSLDPTKRGRHWKSALDEVSIGCMSCHLSQVRYSVDRGEVLIEWRDLAVDCESCHGPGRAHVELHRAGRPADDVDDPYRDLHALPKEEEVALCAQCHAWKSRFRHVPDGAERPDFAYLTLANAEFRSNGTQMATGYQTAGHLLSPCYTEGAMVCSSCHAPHSQIARALTGESAEGAESNRQCTVCHRDMIDHGAFVEHSKHSPSVACVDCHMPLQWVKNSTAGQQRVSDHAVSIPRPRETIDAGNPNACNDCHTDHDPKWALEALRAWGYEEATKTRDWITAIEAGRERQRGATQLILQVVRRFEDQPFLLASLLELLSQQAPAAAVVGVVRQWIDHDDHLVRAWAYRALIAHDRALSGRWMNRGSSDAHPIVRMLVFQGFGDEQLFSESVLKRHLEDVLRYSERPPINELRYLTMIRMRRKEWDRALETLELAERYATVHDSADFELGTARANIERARRRISRKP